MKKKCANSGLRADTSTNHGAASTSSAASVHHGRARSGSHQSRCHSRYSTATAPGIRMPTRPLDSTATATPAPSITGSARAAATAGCRRPCRRLPTARSALLRQQGECAHGELQAEAQAHVERGDARQPEVQQRTRLHQHRQQRGALVVQPRPSAEGQQQAEIAAQRRPQPRRPGVLAEQLVARPRWPSTAAPASRNT